MWPWPTSKAIAVIPDNERCDAIAVAHSHGQVPASDENTATPVEPLITAPAELTALVTRLEVAERLASGGYGLTWWNWRSWWSNPCVSWKARDGPWQWRDFQVQPLGDGRWQLQRSSRRSRHEFGSLAALAWATALRDDGADAEWMSQFTLTALAQASRWRHSAAGARCIEATAKALQRHDPRLAQTVFGCRFANPVGLAAGFDKNAVAAGIWQAFGFGFAELGTITAQAQPGNPKPRLFPPGQGAGSPQPHGF